MANLTYRQATQTVPASTTTKNLPLTNAEIDGNLKSLNDAKAEINQTMYIGTTALAINRATGSLSLTGVSIDGNAGTVTNGVYTSGSYSDPAWLTISKSKVGLGNVENTALSTWVGSTNITTIGAATASSLVVTGNLTVNGTTTTINSTNLSVDDVNIELASVAPVTGLSATIASGSSTVTVTSTAGLVYGQRLVKTSGTGVFGAGAYVASIVDATTFTTSVVHATSGSITFTATHSDVTAQNGGIIIKGTTDKQFIFVNEKGGWNSSESINIDSDKVFKINNTNVLSATTLGSGVTESSLTSVGTIATGTWQGSIVGSTYGGTGVNNGTKTITLGGNLTTSGAFNTTLTVTDATSVTLPTTGTLATLAGTETLTNKTITSATFSTSLVAGTTTVSLLNTVATTINFGGAATTIGIGASTGTTTVNNSLNVSGQVNFGATSRPSYYYLSGCVPSIWSVNNSANTTGYAAINYGGPGGLVLTRSNGATPQSRGLVVKNDYVGTLLFGADDNSSVSLVKAAAIHCIIDENSGAGNMPGRLVFATTSVGGSSPTESMIITSSQEVLVGQTIVSSTIPSYYATGSRGGSLQTGSYISLNSWANNQQGRFVMFNKSRTTSPNTGTGCSSGDDLGGLLFNADDGANFIKAAAILSYLDSATTTGNAKGSLSFRTSVGSNTLTEQLRIDGDGKFTMSNATIVSATIANNVSLFTTTTGTITVGSTSASAVQLPSGKTKIGQTFLVQGGSVNITLPTIAGTLAIDNQTMYIGTTAVAINRATADLALTGITSVTGTTTAGLYSTATNAVTVDSGTTGAVNIGTNANAKIITIGNVTGATTINLNTGTGNLQHQAATAVTNAINYNLRLLHVTSGTPAAGIGTGLEFSTETTSGNNEVGGRIAAVATDVTAGSEDFDLRFYAMAAGSISSTARFTITGTGDCTAAGNVTAYSDIRLKTNVETVKNALDTTKQLRGVTFEKDGKSGVGVIAQEVQKVLPQVVIEGNDEDKTLSVAYGNIVGVLIEAIKELSAEVDALKKQVNG